VATSQHRRRTAGGSYSISYDGRRDTSQLRSVPEARLQSILKVDGTPYNRLYQGDNARILKSLAQDSSVAGKVKLVYIDPPFATQARFESDYREFAYDDGLAGSEYLEFLRQRLVLISDLMASDASIYLHLDARMVFPAKVVMDEIFGETSFRSMISRVKCNPKNYTSRQYGDVLDYILFYASKKGATWNQPFVAWTEEAAQKEYAHVEEHSGRRYKKVPCYAPGRRNGATGGRWKGQLPPEGKHWVFSPSKLDELDRRGQIVWSSTGNPRRKIYLDESPGIRMSNLWTNLRDTQNQSSGFTGYPTEKNIDLLRTIVLASSNPGDLVLDAFSGSGTTLVAADEFERRWIGIDSSHSAMRTTIRRLALGTPRMGSHVERKSQSWRSAQSGSRSGLEVLVDRSIRDGRVKAAEARSWMKP
jgi:adenine-specific DNA-methyltransferase